MMEVAKIKLKSLELFNYIEHSKNQGKGVAVYKALCWANNHNYTHAIQIDADGQHRTEDIPRFIELARKNPDVLICGVPIFDSSVPKHRTIGHKITTFWIHIETLSTTVIQYALCGYRL